MRVPRSVQKAVNEGRKKVKYCPPVRVMLANRRFQRTLTAFAPLTRVRSASDPLGWKGGTSTPMVIGTRARESPYASPTHRSQSWCQSHQGYQGHGAKWHVATEEHLHDKRT